MGLPTVSSDRTHSGRFSTADTPDGEKRRHTPTKRRLLFTKPIFDGETFYLDLPGYNDDQQLENDILQLGGKIEKFLSRDITCVVSNNKRPSNRKSSASSTPVSSSPMAMLSRGRALMLKANATSSPKVSDILGRAEEMGIKIKPLPVLVKQIETEKSKCNSKDKINDVDSMKGPAKKNKIRKLKQPYLKVEHVSCKYKPQFNTFQSFPTIMLDLSVDENEVLRVHQGSPFEPYAPSAINSARAALTNATKAKATAKKSNKTQAAKGGYCECCDQHFKDSIQHAKSLKHRSFVANKENFTLLDSLLENIPSVDDLIQTYSQTDENINDNDTQQDVVKGMSNCEEDTTQVNGTKEIKNAKILDHVNNEVSAQESAKESIKDNATLDCNYPTDEKKELKTIINPKEKGKERKDASAILDRNTVTDSAVVQKNSERADMQEKSDIDSFSKKIDSCIAAVIGKSSGKHIDKAIDIQGKEKICDKETIESTSTKLFDELNNPKTELTCEKIEICDHEEKVNHKGPDSPVSIDTDELAESTTIEKNAHDTNVNKNEKVTPLASQDEMRSHKEQALQLQQYPNIKEETDPQESQHRPQECHQQKESHSILPQVDLDVELQDLASFVQTDLFENANGPIEFPDMKNVEEFSIHDLLVSAAKTRISTEHESFSDFSSEIKPSHDVDSIIERLGEEENENNVKGKSTQVKNKSLKFANTNTFGHDRPHSLPQNKPTLNPNDYWEDWSKPCDNIEELNVSKLYPKWSMGDVCSNSQMDKENMPILQPFCDLSKETEHNQTEGASCNSMPQLQPIDFSSYKNMENNELNMPHLKPACLFQNENIQHEEKSMPALQPVCLFSKENNSNLGDNSTSQKTHKDELLEKNQDVLLQQDDSEEFIDVCSISMDKNNNTSILNSPKFGDVENTSMSAKPPCFDSNKGENEIKANGISPKAANTCEESNPTPCPNQDKFLSKDSQPCPEKCDNQRNTQDNKNCDKDSLTHPNMYDKQQACSNFKDSLLQKDPYAFNEDSNEPWVPRYDAVNSQRKICTPKRNTQIDDCEYGQWAATPTSQLKLKLKRVVLTPKTTVNNFCNSWSVHRSGDCKLVFSAGSSRKRNRKSVNLTASKNSKRRKLDFND